MATIINAPVKAQGTVTYPKLRVVLDSLQFTLDSLITGTLTANRVVVTDASTLLSTSTVTTTELAYLSTGFVSGTLKIQETGGGSDTVSLITSSFAASRNYTLDDVGANANFVMTQGSQQIAGTKTFSSQILITATTNHLVLSTSSQTATILATTQSVGSIYTIPNVGTSDFVMTVGNQTLAGTKTFSSQIISTATSNHLKLATASNNAIISVASIATSDRTITIPDPGTNANFVLSEAAATINGQKTFGSAVLFANGSVSAPNGFSGDTNNGFYYIGTDNWALSAGSTKCVDIQAAGVAVIGTNTNDSAAAGFIGEVLSNSTVRSSALTLTSNTAKTIASITLTAGDWDVYTAIGFTVTSGNAGSTALAFSTSGTTNTISGVDTTALSDATGQIRTELYGKAIALSTDDDLSGQHWSRISVSTSTTYYAVALAIYATGTIKGYGSIVARRAR